MRDVTDGVDLANLQAAGNGFIFNNRTGGGKLHRAGCEAVGAMHAGAYSKIFFDSAVEAVNWLDSQHGTSGWQKCGYCAGHIGHALHLRQ